QYSIMPDVAYDFIELTEPLLQLARIADCFCFGTLIQRANASRATLMRLLEESPSGAMRFLDMNLRPGCHTANTVVASLQHANALKLNESEALDLSVILGWEKYT